MLFVSNKERIKYLVPISRPAMRSTLGGQSSRWWQGNWAVKDGDEVSSSLRIGNWRQDKELQSMLVIIT